MSKFWINGKAAVSDRPVPLVTLWYPRQEGNAKAVEIDLCCVRAADSILVEYDFERDGWVIKQASRFEFDASDTVCDPGWKEVAFVQAWAPDKRDTQ